MAPFTNDSTYYLRRRDRLNPLRYHQRPECAGLLYRMMLELRVAHHRTKRRPSENESSKNGRVMGRILRLEGITLIEMDVDIGHLRYSHSPIHALQDDRLAVILSFERLAGAD